MTAQYGKLYAGQFNTSAGLIEVYSLKGPGIMPEYRFYPFAKENKIQTGLFTSIHFRYFYLKRNYIPPNSSDIETDVLHLLNSGLNVGYKCKLNSFIFELLCGYGLVYIKEPIKYYSLYFENFTSKKDFIRLEISIGFAFPKSKETEKILD